MFNNSELFVFTSRIKHLCKSTTLSDCAFEGIVTKILWVIHPKLADWTYRTLQLILPPLLTDVCQLSEL